MIHETIRRLPSNAIHNLVALLLPVAASLAATPFIVHGLGEERFGLYMLVLSVVGFGGLVDLGLATASVKFVAECRARGDASELSKTANSVITLRLPCAVGLVVIGYLSAPFVCARVLLISPALVSEAVLLVRIAITTVAVSVVGGTLAALPRAAHRYDMVSRASLVFGLAITGTTVWLVWAGYGLQQIVLAELLIACMSLVVSGIQARRTIPEWRYRPALDIQTLRRLLVFGGYVAVGTLTGFLYAHANRILVGRMLGTAAVAYYSVPWNLSARIVQLVHTLAEVITPLASALAARHDLGTLRGLYRRAFRVMAVVTASAVVPLFVGAADLLGLWLGPTFADRSGLTFRVLVLSAGTQSLGAVPYMMLNGMGHPARAMIPTVIGALVNIGLAVLWGAPLGLPGIALAVACGLVVQTALLTMALDGCLDMPHGSLRSLARPVVATVVATGAGLAVAMLVSNPWVRLLSASLVGLSVLHGVLLVTGWYERREVEFLWHALISGTPRVGEHGGPHEGATGGP